VRGAVRPEVRPPEEEQWETAAVVRRESGGYVGFFDSEKGDHETFMAKGDAVAARRLKLKSQAEGARREIRYQRYASQLTKQRK
jgi:hypothetical protein